MLTNCDYAIECGKKLDCKLVGIGGLFIITILIIINFDNADDDHNYKQTGRQYRFVQC